MATKKSTTKPVDRIKVVITTSYRGVFFGEIDPAAVRDEVIEIHNKRCCVRFKGSKGFVGLASVGPQAGSRVGPAAPVSWLRNVTDILLCTPEAVERWEAAPWT